MLWVKCLRNIQTWETLRRNFRTSHGHLETPGDHLLENHWNTLEHSKKCLCRQGIFSWFYFHLSITNNINHQSRPDLFQSQLLVIKSVPTQRHGLWCIPEPPGPSRQELKRQMWLVVQGVSSIGGQSHRNCSRMVSSRQIKLWWKNLSHGKVTS